MAFFWATVAQIPYFNAPIFLENKTQVGKVEEIFGPINKSVSLLSLPQVLFHLRRPAGAL